MLLHDDIWFNAVRALVSAESRKEASIVDHTLDHLIQVGLIDREESEVSRPMQQWLRYPAILANWLVNSQGVVAKEVGSVINSGFEVFVNTFL